MNIVAFDDINDECCEYYQHCGSVRFVLKMGKN